LTHYPNELSGGESQRVAIARAIINEPTLLLADEPTGNLDSQVGREIMSLFLSLNEQMRMTLILVTHDPQIAQYAERILFLKDGKLQPGL
ncbi:MAG: ATP-binding cassette domain-containing protein, partial [Nitrospinota bacterium]